MITTLRFVRNNQFLLWIRIHMNKKNSNEGSERNIVVWKYAILQFHFSKWPSTILFIDCANSSAWIGILLNYEKYEVKYTWYSNFVSNEKSLYFQKYIWNHISKPNTKHKTRMAYAREVKKVSNMIHILSLNVFIS